MKSIKIISIPIIVPSLEAPRKSQVVGQDGKIMNSDYNVKDNEWHSGIDPQRISRIKDGGGLR